MITPPGTQLTGLCSDDLSRSAARLEIDQFPVAAFCTAMSYVSRPAPRPRRADLRLPNRRCAMPGEYGRVRLQQAFAFHHRDQFSSVRLAAKERARSRKKPPWNALRHSATLGRCQAIRDAPMLACLPEEYFRFFCSFGVHTCAQSARPGLECHRRGRAMEGFQWGKRLGGNINLCGSGRWPLTRSGCGWWQLPIGSPLGWSASFRGARFRAPVRRAVVSPVIPAECRLLHRETAFLY